MAGVFVSSHVMLCLGDKRGEKSVNPIIPKLLTSDPFWLRCQSSCVNHTHSSCHNSDYQALTWLTIIQESGNICFSHYYCSTKGLGFANIFSISRHSQNVLIKSYPVEWIIYLSISINISFLSAAQYEWIRFNNPTTNYILLKLQHFCNIYGKLNFSSLNYCIQVFCFGYY